MDEYNYKQQTVGGCQIGMSEDLGDKREQGGQRQ